MQKPPLAPRRPALKAILGVFCLFAWSSAQIPVAPERPDCTALSGLGACDWKATNGVGPGVRVVLSDRTGGHAKSKEYLRDALTRLSEKYGFTLTRIDSLNDITDDYLRNAKVIIFSSGDGTSGGSIPDATVRARVENFVKERGWGMIMIHSACSFIATWPFQEQACVQQQNQHLASGTMGTISAENRTVNGVPHGRANPYTSFFLAGLPDTVRMSEEWFIWKEAPIATTQVGGVSLANLTMLFRLKAAGNSAGGSPPAAIGEDHDVMWTHTQGKGITIHNSMGHDDMYQQDSIQGAFGDSLLWREIRYAAKDWDTVSPVSVLAPRFQARFGLSGKSGSITLSFAGASRVTVDIVDVAGQRVYSHAYVDGGSVEIKGLKRGIYFVHIASGQGRETRKVTLF
jgi:hypothetical protein